jgi:TolB-like protein/DNA-binding winged helix-turn-helix (wHTH) protein/Tfp pilus assembly protein PilF
LAASLNQGEIVRFEDFELDLQSGELRCNGDLVKLQLQPAKILTVLVSQPGKVVSRKELAKEVWGSETFVDFELGLNFAIRQIRTALGDDADHPRFIETLPKRGYRFVAPLKARIDSPVAESSRPQSKSTKPALWIGVAFASLALLFVLGHKIWSNSSSRPSSQEQIRIAVMPFKNLTGEPAQEFVSDGFTEEMITQLGSLEHDRLSVIARTSSMAYKDTTKSVDQIGRELQVQYLLEGSVRSWNNRIRVTAQLIQTDDQSHIWAQNYESERKDILRVQSEIAEAIGEQIRLSLSSKVKASLTNVPAVDPEVYELCLLGRYEWNKRTEEGLDKSIGYFQQAIARDSRYVQAYTGLANAYLVSAFYGRGSARDLYDKAEATAKHAIELDDLSFQAHTTLGMVASSYLRQGAAGHFKRALEIAPNYATAHHWYAFDLWRTGHHGDALAELERARQLDPLSPIISTDEGVFLTSAGETEKAISLLERTLVFAPQFAEAHRSLAVAYLEKGRLSDAAAEARSALELNPDNIGMQATLAYVDAVSGRTKPAQERLRALQRIGGTAAEPWFFEAWIYVGLNQRQKAIDCLEKEYQAHTPMMVAISLEPIFKPLMSDPRFQNLLARIQTGE